MPTISSAIRGGPPITNASVPEYYPSRRDTYIWPTESLGLMILPKEWEFEEGHCLGSALLVQVRTSRDGVLAVTYLDAEEFGRGVTEAEAVKDLLTSLVEYKRSLEARQDRLGESALADLRKLRQLIQPTSGKREEVK